MGAKHLNSRAREQRDFILKPVLKGMHCKQCPRVDTIISFKERYNSVEFEIAACCDYFDQRINELFKNDKRY